MATGAQPERIKCSKCGKTFDTPEEARQHERNCSGRDRVAGTPTAENPEQTKKDMEIEESFEATDN